MHSATELVTRSIEVMMESGCEEKYSAALALPYADQKPVFESPTPTKLIAPLSQGLSDSRRTKLTTERQQASQASLEWLMKKRKAFDRRGDMVVAAWAEQQQHEMNLRVHRLSRSKVGLNQLGI